jgi:hypothetical protein
MNFKWEEVHDVAEQLEHIQSPKLILELDKFLGYPEKDPHGAVIPNQKGEYKITPQITLSSLAVGDRCRLTSVKDSSVSFLQYVSKIGLVLSSEVFVEEWLKLKLIMTTRFLFISIVSYVLIFAAACQSDSTSTTGKSSQLDYETLAKDLCNCASESIALNTEMKGYLDAGDNKAFDATVNKVQIAFDGAILCAKSAKKKLGSSLKKTCSEMPPRLTLELLDKVK